VISISSPKAIRHVSDPVVVHLHGKLRALYTERREQLRLAAERLDGRDGLRHAAEDDAGAVALERDRHETRTGLEPDLVELERRSENESGSERRMPGERELDGRSEDAHACGPLALRRKHERALRVVHLPRERLHRRAFEPACVREDGELVPGQRRVREDVGEDVAIGRHRARA
jgi:hypothetical protein